MRLKRLIVLCMALLFAAGGYAQRTKEALQAEIKSLQQEIETANKLLKETSKNKEVTLNQVSLMDKKIKNRQKLINAYNEQIKGLDRNIKKGERNIKQLNGELKTLQNEYSKMVVFAYRNKDRYNQLEFLFSSEDFNQAIQRKRYIQQFADARKTKMDQIVKTQKKVSGEVDSYKKNMEEQTQLLNEEQAQQAVLKKEKAELNAQVAALKKKEGSIQQNIKDKQAQAKKFQKEIDKIIAEEIKKTNEKNANSGSAGKTGKSGMALTPRERALSTSFSANKGNFPWPVERGVVSSTFGKHQSAVSDKVFITNNGIDIATSENARARAIFDGEVVSVVKPSASNMAVIIRHGDYFTVYSQMDEVLVKKGDQVKTKQDIGRVHTDRTEGKTELHFELRQGTECLNPTSWLAR